MPESLVSALGSLGRHVDSINCLRLKGIDDVTLYREIAKDYDLCFTRDVGFAHNVRQMREAIDVKVLRVMLPQQRTEQFVPLFVHTFEQSDWSAYNNGSDWP